MYIYTCLLFISIIIIISIMIIVCYSLEVVRMGERCLDTTKALLDCGASPNQKDRGIYIYIYIYIYT